MSATQQTLAQLVRAKFPHAYDDMDDSTLEQNVLAKHPEYGDLPRTPDLKTGAGMMQNAQRQATAAVSQPLTNAALPGQYSAGEKPGLVSRVAQTMTGVPHPLNQISGYEVPMLADRPGEYAMTGLKQVALMPFQAASSAILHPLNTAESILPVNRAISDVKNKNYGAAAGNLIGGVANVYGLAKGVQQLPNVAESAASALNDAGVPIPPSINEINNSIASKTRYPATAGQVALGRAGSPKLAIPLLKSAEDFILPKGNVGTLTYPSDVALPPRMASDLVNQVRLSNLGIGEMPQPTAIEEPPLGSPDNPGFYSPLPRRMPKAQSPSIFSGMATTSPEDVAQLPPMQPLQSTQSGEATSTGPAVTLKTPFTPKPVKSLILTPEQAAASAPRVEGSYWSFKESALRDAVLSGDRDAAIVYKQRFGTLPVGSKYITDVGDKPNSGLYESRK